jgi:hypothetical protein
VGKETKQDKSVNTNTFFIDTGSSNSDGITNNNTITINDLEVGETWQYSIDSGVSNHNSSYDFYI